MGKVHACLNKQVWKATKKIVDKEKDWDQTELCKRITKYLYKGAQAPELLTLPWQQAASQFIENAMRGYSNACADKPWFFDLDLTVSFHMAFWEILSGSGQSWAAQGQRLGGSCDMQRCPLGRQSALGE
eukprot:Skav222245  [mRNA]  locus=scaffold3059:185236:188073:- [translate_table: standard]